MEKQHFFSDRPTLYGMLYIPDSIPLGATLIVHPFCEEKKSAQRVLADVAQTLAAKREYVLLFDLRGCGDSEGDMSDADLTDWIEDIQKAAGFLKAQSGCKEISMIGLRLGAYLTSLYVPRAPAVKRIVLLEPVFRASDDFRKMLRDKQMKELLTRGRIASKRDELIANLSNGQVVDFNGYPITGKMYLQMVEYDRGEPMESLFSNTAPIYVVPIHSFDKQDKKYNVLKAYPHIRSLPLKLAPFWTQIEKIDDSPLLMLMAKIYSDN